jgi:cardiolipin synthase
MEDLSTWAWIGYLLTLVLVPWVLFWARKESVSTVAWILAIVAVPYVGGLCYLLFGQTHIVRRKIRRKRSSNLSSGSQRGQMLASAFHKDVEALPGTPVELGRLARLAQRVGRFEPVEGNRIELYSDGQKLYDAMERAILEARGHIELFSYIVQPDEFGYRFRDLLVQKAREGVEVRFLYDGVGSFRLDQRYLRPLQQAGVRCAVFLPVNPLKGRFQINLRNHRKILVTDGRRAFTGGFNIGRDYCGLPTRYGRWWDLHLDIEGPLVEQVQDVFAEDWAFATGEVLSAGLFPPPKICGEETAQVVAGGPDRDLEVMHHLYFSALASARKRAYIMTPYFVPDQAMVKALESAALQGVEVRLMVPWRSNYRTVDYAGRWFYENLMAAGVRLHAYTSGMLHAKMMTVDGRWSTVGTANFDIRSFRLNFEMNVNVYGEGFAQNLERVFLDLARRSCLELGPDNFGRRGRGSRLVENVCRLLAPIL